MVDELNVPVTIHAVPIVREPDGLAMSSRNRLLSAEERNAATVLSRALRLAAAAVAGGERDAERIRQILHDCIKSESLARFDYGEVADPTTLEPLSELKPGRQAVALLAVRIGAVRLIDNAVLLG
jgi:pantoate--beta-alanine ligase